MIINILLLVLGMVLMIKGADFFVDGASSIAKALKIPTLIIGLTLVSIGTSAPELSVSVTSALQGKDDMSFGNVIGSNIFNVCVVIGISAMLTPMIVSKDILKKDIPILLGVYGILALFAFIISPLTIEKYEGNIIFTLFIVYTVYLFIRAKKEPHVEEVQEEKKNPWWKNLLFVGLGLAGIIVGGDFVVDSASAIALELGMSELLVSLTIVALGTSLPELVTSIVAAKKGENDIAVGNAVGSCLFNVVLILGISTLVYPVGLELYQLIDLFVMIIAVVLILIFASKTEKIKADQGAIFVIVYILYLAFIIIREFPAQ